MDSAVECMPLIHRGWWLAGLTLASYRAELMPGDYPPYEQI